MAVNEAPIAPHVLLDLENFATQTLYPRLKLYEALANFNNEPKPREPSKNGAEYENRRDFLDAFSYLCDTERGGKTVTAAALQEVSNVYVLWLAANEGISNDVLHYAKKLLSILGLAEEKNAEITKQSVFLLAQEKCERRISSYKDDIKKHAQDCQTELRNSGRYRNARKSQKKLDDLLKNHASLTLDKFIDFCFHMRDKEMNWIKDKSKARKDSFGQLAHYIYRISATREKSNMVVEAVINDRSLRHSLRRIQIKTVGEAPEEKVKEMNYVSPQEILYDICSELNPLHAEQAFAGLYKRDRAGEREIHKNMKSKKFIKTRVHAELQISDVFSRDKDLKFVGGDKYIGCSKPACYFCHAWLKNHKYSYVLPATHGRIVLGCRGPDHTLNVKGADVVRKVYDGISRQLGNDIVHFLRQGYERRNQYMSTEAGTRAPSLIAGI